MVAEIEVFLANHLLIRSGPFRRSDGGVAYPITLPPFPYGREFVSAELVLPRGFPEYGYARILLSKDAVLRIPHVESSGALCIEGDPGPGRDCSPEQRLALLLHAFEHDFLWPWIAGQLDGEFAQEAQHYWTIQVARSRTHRDPIHLVWTVDSRPLKPFVRKGLLVLPGRIVVAAPMEVSLAASLINSLGANAKQIISVSIADIPLSLDLTPSTWPTSTSDLDRMLAVRLDVAQLEAFSRPLRRRARGNHRIVLLRCPSYSLGYLMPGGPPTVVESGKSTRAYPSRREIQPLLVNRIDPSWTEGRDQHPVVFHRQSRHVLVFGAGALGSIVVDHLAKAGIGFIFLVDPDIMSAANIGRHLLGAESLEKNKAKAVARRVGLSHPSARISAFDMTAEDWLQEHSLVGIDTILDLTGDPDVRWRIDRARIDHPCPLLIGWMEPFVAAAHACTLPSGFRWMQDTHDMLADLQAVEWPADVTQREPACSSLFQSYTAAAAAYAVALVTENALALLDGGIDSPKVSSWVRGQAYLDRQRPGLSLRDWASVATPHDGLIIERPFP